MRWHELVRSTNPTAEKPGAEHEHTQQAHVRDAGRGDAAVGEGRHEVTLCLALEDRVNILQRAKRLLPAHAGDLSIYQPTLALQTLDDEVQPERELEIVVAAAKRAVVSCRYGQPGHVRVGGEEPRHLLRGRSLARRWLGVVERVLREAEQPATEHVQCMVGHLE